MPLYDCRGIDDYGKEYRGQLEAESEKELENKLAMEGYYLLSVERVAGKIIADKPMVVQHQQPSGHLQDLVLLQPSWWNYLAYLVWGGIFCLGGFLFLFVSNEPFGTRIGILFALLVFGGLVISIAFLKRHSERYYISFERVWTERGIFSRKTSEIKISHIQNIRVNQGIIDRMFGIGTIFFETSSPLSGETVFWKISDPMGVKEGIIRLEALLQDKAKS